MILNADARAIPLASSSVHCVVTSPPYWALRDYGMAGQIGLEESPELYVAALVEVFREVWRVLRDDGTAWLNLGDCYASAGGDPANRDRGVFGLKPKDLVGMPWRVAFALQAAGWWLRSDIVWSKPNPMPESIGDRPTKSHEYLFLLAKSERYYYDGEAVKEPASDSTHLRISQNVAAQIGSARANGGTRPGRPMKTVMGPQTPKAAAPESRIKNNTSMEAALALRPLFRNRRTVWEIPTQGYPDAHFATFPEDLVQPCILAGTSERGCCPACGAPWQRVVEKTGGTTGSSWHDHQDDLERGQRDGGGKLRDGWVGGSYKVETTGWRAGCACGRTDTAMPLVLDPFAGSGTVGQVCHRQGRRFVGLELKPEYCRLAFDRTAQKGLV